MNFELLPWNLLFVLARTSVMLAFLPMFGEIQVPRAVRAGLAIWVSLAIFPLVPPAAYAPAGVADLGFAIGMECALGALYAICVRIIFSAILLGAQWIDSELGFQASQQINPVSGVPHSPVTSLLLVVGAMLFWALGFFEDLLLYWAKVFQLLPPPILSISPFAGDTLIQLSSTIFTGGLQIAAPILFVMFLVSVAIGFMARALQGVNILVEGYTIKMVSGLGSLLMLAPLLIQLMHRQIGRIPDFWEAFTRVLRAT